LLVRHICVLQNRAGACGGKHRRCGPPPRGGFGPRAPQEPGSLELSGPCKGAKYGPPGSKSRIGTLYQCIAASGRSLRREASQDAGLRPGEASARGLLRSPIHWNCRALQGDEVRSARLKEPYRYIISMYCSIGTKPAEGSIEDAGLRGAEASAAGSAGTRFIENCRLLARRLRIAWFYGLKVKIASVRICSDRGEVIEIWIAGNSLGRSWNQSRNQNLNRFRYGYR